MSDLIPKIKKELKSFILEEKGGAQKQVLISMGAMLVGLESLNIISQVVWGANISSRHDHCDPGHGSAGSAGWHGSAHCNADGVPTSHCSQHSNNPTGWQTHASINPGHTNNVVLNYG
jgi:hypothetical protein